MTASTPTAPLQDLSLGDVVTLAGSRSYTVRSVATWMAPIVDLSGFVLLGEMELLLGIPSSGRPVDLFLPSTKFTDASGIASISEGVSRYWAPHLPSHGGAMAELLYRIVLVQGKLEPVFLLYRGEEAVVFERSRGLSHEHMRTERMTRGASEDTLTRHSASFTPVPAYAPPAADLYEHLTSR